jgi:ferredoxin
MSRHALHLQVNPVQCDAYGYCGELLPEMVALDEWGYPIIDPSAVPRELLALARRAVRDCPKRALSLLPPDEGSRGRSRSAGPRR